MQKMHKMESIEAAIVLAIMLCFGMYMTPENMLQFIISGIVGLITYIVVDGFANILQSQELHLMDVAKSSMMGFVYLEVLDASFSLDGVIGAFALSKNLFVIAL